MRFCALLLPLHIQEYTFNSLQHDEQLQTPILFCFVHSRMLFGHVGRWHQ